MSTPATPPPILPLPASVISRLRSTITVPTVSAAISELLQNALDATATELSLTLNPTRPSFALSDNGHGIHPNHISSIGTPYTTSKYPPQDRFFGSRGETLAALAQHSTLSVTSRAAGWRSTRQVRWSYGKKVFEGPAPEYVALEEQGTTVRAEGLWGDMPVRLKAREGMDVEREWDDVLKVICGLLVSGRGKGVGIVVRDEKGARRLTVKGGKRARAEPWDLMVLRQVFGADVIGAVGTWESAKARQNGVRIEGWIRSRGYGSKAVQFLSVNGLPLASVGTELHREANRIFASSGFGTVEDEDGRSTPKRGRARKGVDRHGMFVLRIECRDGRAALGGEGGTDGKAGVEGENLRSVIQLLQRLVHEFLKAHYYKPTIGRAEEDPLRGSRSSSESSPKPGGEIYPRLSTPVSRRNEQATSTDRPRLMDLANWSRVKEIKPNAEEVVGKNTVSSHKQQSAVAGPSSNKGPPPRDTPGDTSTPASVEVIDWIDPRSGRTYEVNTRTGNTNFRSASSIAGTKRPFSATFPTRSISLAEKRPKSVSPQPPNEFLQKIQAKWTNPAFPPTEAPIPSISVESTVHSHGCHDSTSEPFDSTTSQRLGKLTKAGLRAATVISQVDQKYILIKMHGTSTTSPPEMLVIVDQHAADERIRVESLLQELCIAESDPPDPTQSTQKPLTFTISPRDATLLRRFRAEFARWGICYDVEDGRVNIHTLPRVARDRCDTEPVLAIELLRKHCYHLEEHPHSSRITIKDGDWVSCLSRIPAPLKEMANSRACRGAIMFNDPLTLDESKTLIQRLADCKWPFMCAHGRVSMRPLVELGGGGAVIGEGKGGFREVFGRWRREEAEEEVEL